MRRRSLLPLSLRSSLVLVAVACSLQMPSEDEVFGPENGGASEASGGHDSGGAAHGGQTGVSLGGAGGDGGMRDSAGAPDAGANSAGSSAGGSAAGGKASSGGSGGASSGGKSAGGSATFDPEQDLLAHFAFDDTSTTVATNSTDSSKNGSYNGSCNHPTGQLGTAVGVRNLSGSTVDYVELPAGMLKDLTQTTLALWVRDLSTTRKGSRLFDFSRGSAEELYFAPDDTNPANSTAGAHLAGSHSSTSFVDLWTTGALTDKTWHHIGVSWSSSSIQLYIDGQSLGSKSSPGVKPSDLGATSPNWLGRSLDDAFVGLYAEIDDLRIYNRALTAAEISQLYQLR